MMSKSSCNLFNHSHYSLNGQTAHYQNTAARLTDMVFTCPECMSGAIYVEQLSLVVQGLGSNHLMTL